MLGRLGDAQMAVSDISIWQKVSACGMRRDVNVFGEENQRK